MNSIINIDVDTPEWVIEMVESLQQPAGKTAENPEIKVVDVILWDGQVGEYRYMPTLNEDAH